jgi:aspartyl-tRNA(Asn)/glutamyl-tRNA(Gln) amidotransferase subunit A
MLTMQQAASALAEGRITSGALVEGCLAHIDEPAGEGATTFIRFYREQARATASAADGLRRAGRAPGPLAGIPISIKDLLCRASPRRPARLCWRKRRPLPPTRR